jgi:hypothetical protein
MKKSILRRCGALAVAAALGSGCASRPDHLPSRDDRAGRPQEWMEFTGVWSAHDSDRTITIRATATALVVEPPTLPSEIYRLDGAEYTSVRDVGAWWIKNRTRLQRIDPRTLTLKTTSFTGWWHAQRPEEVTSDLSQLETTRTLTLGNDGVLTMKTVAVDAKPWVMRHVDVLVRNAPPPREVTSDSHRQPSLLKSATPALIR